MGALFKKLTQKNHLLAAYRQVAEKYLDPDSLQFRRFVPGIDGVDLREFEDDIDASIEACRDFLLHGKEFLPQILRLIPKDGKDAYREIYLIALRDKVIQKAIAILLQPILERIYSRTLFSYRRPGYLGQSEALRQVRKFLKAHPEGIHLFKTDVSNYVDHLDHGILRRQLKDLLPGEPQLLELLDKYIDHPRYRDSQIVYPSEGVPAGSALTPALGNLYLSDLDLEMERGGYQYFRYGDDILLLETDSARLIEGRDRILAILKERGLTCSPAKTYTLEPGQPFDYLGHRFESGHLQVGSKAYNNYREWARRFLKVSKYRNFPRRSLQDRKRLLGRILRDLQRESEGALGPLGWIRNFPMVSDDRRLRELDRFVKNRIRLCVAGRSGGRNFERVPEEWFRELGYKSLVGAYHRVRHQRALGPYVGWRRFFGSNYQEKLRAPEGRVGRFKRRLTRWWDFLRSSWNAGTIDDSAPNSAADKNGYPESRSGPSEE